MNKLKTIFLLTFLSIAISACQSVSKKIEDTTEIEHKELSKWLNKSESELKSFYGQPDNVEFLNSKNFQRKSAAWENLMSNNVVS